MRVFGLVVFSNAGKFTEEGGEVVVTVSVQQLPVCQVAASGTHGEDSMFVLSPSTPNRTPGNQAPKYSTSCWEQFKEGGRTARRIILDPGLVEVDSKDVNFTKDGIYTTAVVITVSNTRTDRPMSKPEECFIPFRQKGGEVGHFCQ